MGMYNQYTGYGYPSQPTFKRIPKYQVYNMIAMYVYQAHQTQVKNVLKLDEAPDALRHSCLYTGITFLPKQFFSLQSDLGIIQVPYYFCAVCGNLYVYQNFYE